ncbi:MAG: amidase [Clostridia bacterium]
MSILDVDATTLAHKIKAHAIRSEEAVNAYIQQIKRINPVVNCLVEERFAQAMEEAKQADRKVDSHEAKGRLFGVPISMKEAFDVAGMHTTGGLKHRSSVKAAHDAEVVARLKAEGAIILGKTNTPALCFCQETDNKLFGRTNNPWNPSRTAGGSSGGEGALIAVGGAAVGLGSDIGGSIRFPSHFNGVIGFKSGAGMVSQHGHFPFVDEPLQEKMLGIGAIAKSVQDTRLLNSIIARKVPPGLDLNGFQIVIPHLLPIYQVDKATRSCVREIKETLAENFEVVSDFPPFFAESTDLWQLIMSIDGGSSIARLAFGERASRYHMEYVKEALFGKSDWHSYLTWALIGANLFKPNQEKIGDIRNTCEKALPQICSYLQHRLLIMPVYHTTALPHGTVYREIFSVRKTYRMVLPFITYANTWGLPALTVPVAIDAEGLPIAVQIVSCCGNEDAIFQMGELFESNFRGYVRCTQYDEV